MHVDTKNEPVTETQLKIEKPPSISVIRMIQ